MRRKTKKERLWTPVNGSWFQPSSTPPSSRMDMTVASLRARLQITSARVIPFYTHR
ncbi:unnamed protein product, partial [Heterosigma akashiwo]